MLHRYGSPRQIDSSGAIRMRTVAASATLRFALLALVGAIACSTAADQGTDLVRRPLSAAPSPCDGLNLSAERNYRPRSWADGQVAFAGGALTFVIPGDILVTAGAAGHGAVEFTYRSGSGEPT